MTAYLHRSLNTFGSTRSISMCKQMGILFAHAMSRIFCVWRHLLFLNALRRVFKRLIYVERKILSREMKDYNNFTHISNTVDIHSVCGTLDEDILMIKVRTERDKSPKWSLEFDLTKIKMFPGENKRWRLVSRRWSFIVMSHGVIYRDDRPIRDPIWEGNFEFELVFLQLWS